METINLILKENPVPVLAVFLLLMALLLALLVQTRKRLAALQAKYDFFLRGADEEADFEDLLTDTLTRLRQAQAELAALRQSHERLEERVRGCLQVAKLERYDAFEAMGGELSYSLLLADGRQNGVILTSIYGREDNRCYAKALTEGKPSHPLAEEEARLLAKDGAVKP